MVLINNFCWANGNGICNNNQKSVESMVIFLDKLNEKMKPVAMF
jgi:hypothetical protein